MNDTILSLVFVCIQFFVIALVRYGLFRDSLRLPLGWTFLLVCSLVVGLSVLWYVGGQFLPLPVFRFFLLIFTFCLSCFLIRERFAKHALSYLTLFTYSTSLEGISTFIHANVQSSFRLDLFLGVFLLLVSIYPAFLLIRWVTERIASIHSDRTWNYLCLCGFSVLLLHLSASSAISSRDVRFLMYYIFLLSSMFGVYAAAIWIQRGMEANLKTKTSLELANRQVDLQKIYYENIVSQMDEIRHIRHDLRHHYAILQSLAQSGDTKAALDYVNNLPTLDAAAPVTGNLVADSLVGFYSAQAQELGFSLEAELSVSKKIPVSDSDLCILLGNLMENALDAQRYLAEQDRYVRVVARADDNSFTLAVDNRFDGFLQKKDDRLVSRKPGDAHGIGLSSVRAVCKKYNGVLQLETEGDLFMAGIVIGV